MGQTKVPSQTSLYSRRFSCLFLCTHSFQQNLLGMGLQRPSCLSIYGETMKRLHLAESMRGQFLCNAVLYSESFYMAETADHEIIIQTGHMRKQWKCANVLKNNSFTFSNTISFLSVYSLLSYACSVAEYLIGIVSFRRKYFLVSLIGKSVMNINGIGCCVSLF